MNKDKLVRDLIPSIIEDGGNTCTFRIAKDISEHTDYLRLKIIEETEEFIQNPSYEEAADILEVVKSFCYLNNLEFDRVKDMAERKKKERGGFSRGTILQYVNYKMN
mgnify:CR=1 FL=1